MIEKKINIYFRYLIGLSVIVGLIYHTQSKENILPKNAISNRKPLFFYVDLPTKIKEVRAVEMASIMIDGIDLAFKKELHKSQNLNPSNTDLKWRLDALQYQEALNCYTLSITSIHSANHTACLNLDKGIIAITKT